MKKLLLVIIVLLLANTVSYGKGIDAYMQLLRYKDARTQKDVIITEVMQLTDKESSDFWPVYREYELEFNKLIDDRIELIKEFLINYDILTDEKASELAKKVFKLEKRKTKLKIKYFKRFKKALSATIAAKFIQLENQINLVVDLQMYSELPFIK
jgi:hypothetical protein